MPEPFPEPFPDSFPAITGSVPWLTEEQMREVDRAMVDDYGVAILQNRAGGELPDPTWPEESFQELIRIAFKDRFIKDKDHLVIRRLRGEL